MSHSEPQWLTWSRELLAIAQSGLAFTKDPYDLQRYEALRELAGRMVGVQAGVDPQRIVELFAGERGYATPKLEVRAGGAPLLRGDLEQVLATCLARKQAARICYRVPGRPPRVHVAELRWLRPPHLEARLDPPGAVRTLRGDRILWAEPA